MNDRTKAAARVLVRAYGRDFDTDEIAARALKAADRASTTAPDKGDTVTTDVITPNLTDTTSTEPTTETARLQKAVEAAQGIARRLEATHMLSNHYWARQLRAALAEAS